MAAYGEAQRYRSTPPHGSRPSVHSAWVEAAPGPGVDGAVGAAAAECGGGGGDGVGDSAMAVLLQRLAALEGELQVRRMPTCPRLASTTAVRQCSAVQDKRLDHAVCGMQLAF